MVSDAVAQQAIANLIIRSAVDIANGRTKQDVIARLTGEGCSPEAALAIVTRAQALKRAEARRSGTRTVLIGAIMCGIGLVITIATYAMTADNGRHYALVMVGLVGGGVCFMIKGFWRIAFG